MKKRMVYGFNFLLCFINEETILEKYLKLYILNINFAKFHTARYIGKITSPFQNFRT